MAKRRRAPLTLEEERRLREALRNRVPHKDIARRFNITSRKIQEIAAKEKLLNPRFLGLPRQRM